MFEYDFCFCGNADQCPLKDNCKRAMSVPGIHTYSLFYEKDKECEYYYPKKKEVDKND